LISKDIIDAFSDLAKDRGIDRTNLGTIIEDLFYNLIHKRYGEERDNFSVIVNMEKGEIEIYQEKEVVDEVIDEVSEIDIKEAQKVEPDLELGDPYIDVINPEVISLGSAYPNPFNPTTSFELNVGNAGHVTMNVYNVMGQVVETLVNNTMDAGSYNITWDATNFSSGMYVVKAETTNGLASQKVMLVK